jgi:hypothetical protein
VITTDPAASAYVVTAESDARRRLSFATNLQQFCSKTL